LNFAQSFAQNQYGKYTDQLEARCSLYQCRTFD